MTSIAVVRPPIMNSWSRADIKPPCSCLTPSAGLSCHDYPRFSHIWLADGLHKSENEPDRHQNWGTHERLVRHLSSPLWHKSIFLHYKLHICVETIRVREVLVFALDGDHNHLKWKHYSRYKIHQESRAYLEIQLNRLILSSSEQISNDR